MSNIVNEFLRPVIDAFNVPLILGLCLIVAIAVTRTASWLWYLIEHRGRRPLVIRMGNPADSQGPSAGHMGFNDSLLAYLAADREGGYAIAPGAGGPAAPGVTTEALEPSHGWAAALLQLAIVSEPSYIVDASWPQAQDMARERKAVVRISRTPGDRVVAAGSFTGSTGDELIGTVGSFCITFLRGQTKLLRHTPRWERWSQDINGYRAYRDGLEHQRIGEYGVALGCFHEAARIEPANLLVQLHRAALLELTHDYEKAVDIYSKCRALWPEHIETGYRLGNARKNAPDQVRYDELRRHLGQLRAQLALKSLGRYWLRTFRPWRWSPGERHYWRSWLQLRLPGRITKRVTYLHAVAIAELLAELSLVLGQPADCPCDGEAEQLMSQLAAQILHKARTPAIARLLDPEHLGKRVGEHVSPWHYSMAQDVSRIPTYHGREHRGNIGWLALFNAACFFSLAINLAPSQLPEGFTQPGWAKDCARAAIRELGMLVRHPQHELEPGWLATDPDLAPLRDSPTGQAWASFVGLSTQPMAGLPDLKGPSSSQESIATNQDS